MADLILAIDGGTQSIRASIIDLEGEILHLVKTPIEPYFSTHPGWAEQDPSYYWEQLCLTCRNLFDIAGKQKERVKGVAVTTQRNTVINVDQNGNPLRPAIVWLDQRMADTSRMIPAFLRPVLKTVKMHDFFEFAIGNCESNWIRQNQPEIWDNTYKYLFLSGFFLFKLTGEFRESAGSNFGYMPIDNKTGGWAGNLDIKWKLFPMEREKLPEIVGITTEIGRITKTASEETGIPSGLPVIAAANDKACEILGSGCLVPETGCLSFGTTATIDLPNRKYIEIAPLYPPFPAAVPGEYYTEVNTMRGFWMVSWFREEFGLLEKLRAEKEGIAPEAFFDDLIKDIPPGSEGLVLHPFWTPGPRDDMSMRGSVIGFTSSHTRAHLYRAILEGVIFSLREGALLLERKNRVTMKELRVSGGGSRSDVAMRIAADIFGIPAVRTRIAETSSIGAAIDAAVGLGYFSDCATAVKEMTNLGDTFEPDPESNRLYSEIFEKVYSKIYRKMLPLFRDLREITLT